LWFIDQENTMTQRLSNPRRRALTVAITGMALASPLMLSGCAGPQLLDYAAEKPAFDLRHYFDGVVDAYGVFTDRSGKVVKRFTVVMRCSWTTAADGTEEGVLDEDFTYADGSQQKRVWRLRRVAGDGGSSAARYVGRADDVVGEAQGAESGNAFRWGYTLRLPVDGKEYEVQFDDWMYRMNDRVVLNKATMSKFGIRLGEVTLSFTKR
jgi:hypothetical protein